MWAHAFLSRYEASLILRDGVCLLCRGDGDTNPKSRHPAAMGSWTFGPKIIFKTMRVRLDVLLCAKERFIYHMGVVCPGKLSLRQDSKRSQSNTHQLMGSCALGPEIHAMSVRNRVCVCSLNMLHTWACGAPLRLEENLKSAVIMGKRPESGDRRVMIQNKRTQHILMCWFCGLN